MKGIENGTVFQSELLGNQTITTYLIIHLPH